MARISVKNLNKFKIKSILNFPLYVDRGNMLIKSLDDLQKSHISNQIEYEITVLAPIEDAFASLTQSEKVNEWGGGPARIQLKLHGDYILWDGEMYGSVHEIQDPYKLVHTLRESIWEKSCIDSWVEWDLKRLERGTKMILKHINLPTQKILERHREGWGDYFLGPLKYYLDSRYRA